jgi:hypothetical protein
MSAPHANRDPVKLFHRPGSGETAPGSDEAIFVSPRRFPETKAC